MMNMGDVDTIESNYKMIYDQLPEAVFISDQHTGTVLDCNEAAEKLTGKSRTDIIGIRQSDLYAGSDADSSFVKGGNGAHYEAEILTKDGESTPVMITASLGRVNGTEAVIQVFTRVAAGKQAEAQKRANSLSASETGYTRLLEQAGDGIGIFQDDHIIFANSALVEITERYGLDIRDKPLEEIISPQSAEFLNDRFHKRVRGEKVPAVYEVELVIDKGKTMPVEMNSTLIEYQGKPALMFILRDITDRKQQEAELRQSQETYSTVVENVNDGILILDENFEALFVNNRTLDIIGFTREEVQALREGPGGTREVVLSLLAASGPEFLQEMMERMAKRMSGEDVPSSLELKLPKKDGSFVYVELNSIVTNFCGKKADLIVMRDIEERVQAEEELLQSAKVLEEMLDGVTITDMTGTITHVNGAIAEQLGYDGEEMVGKSAFEVLLPESEQQKGVEHIARLVSGDAMEAREYWTRRKDGTEFMASINFSLLKDQDGTPTRIIAVSRDITEQKRSENLLWEAEARYTSIFNSSFQMVFVMDLMGKVLDVNGYAIEHMRYSKDELAEMSFHDFAHPDDLPNAVEYLSGILAGRKLSPLTTRVCTKSGEVIWIDVTVTPLHHGEEVYAIVGLAQDITERKQAETALQNSEEHFRALIENASDAIAIVNNNGIIVYESPSVERMLRYRPEDLIGTNAFDLIHLDDIPNVVDAMGPFLAAPGANASMEVRCRDKSGSWCWLEMVAQNLLDNPKVQGIVINYHDITDRVQAEREIRESEQRYRDLYNLSPDVILMLDTMGTVIAANPSIEAMTGYTDEEFQGRSLADLMTLDEPGDLATATKAFEAATGVEEITDLEMRIKHRDGSYRWLNCRTRQLKEEGVLCGFLAIARDITDRKQADEEFARVKREKDAQIVQSAKLANLGEMATGIAHEINQPLNIIKLTCSGLDRSMRKGKAITPEMLAEELEAIDSQIERMRAIIDHMRSFARRSSNVKSEYTDMNVPLLECFKFVGEQLRLREVAVQMDLQDLPQVMADSNKIEQVFLNLIGNARDAMDNFAEAAGPDYKKLLKVRSFVEDGKAVVTFTDTGGGIPQKIRDRVFEPFFTTKEVGKGTGLGLSISYNIINDAGGELSFSVEEGLGTTFKVAVPVSQKQLQEEE